MSHQQRDNDACIPVSNLEESNNGIHSGTTKATTNPVSKKFQICLNSAYLWIQRWNEVFLWMCAIALWLDPLFCYSFVINDDKKCLRVDKKLGMIAIVLRSVMDLLYVIHVIFQFHAGSLCPRAFGIGGVLKRDWAITKRFLIVILSVLPLPQVVFVIIIRHGRDMGFLNAIILLVLVILFQYVPRTLRISPLLKIVRTYGEFVGLALWSFFFYMLSCQLVGAFWYSFAVARKTMCWQEACKNRIGCFRLSCDDILGDYTFLTDSCSITTPNATIFNFGIFLEALDSGIVDSTDFLKKLSYSFWFGLQSLSSVGQNLKTSTSLWEIIFAVLISICGSTLIAWLIGNMQTYSVRSEEMKLKQLELEKMRSKEKEREREMFMWMAFHLLPRDLRMQIIKYQTHNWQGNGGIEDLLHILPKEIKGDIVRHLCMDVLKKVSKLQNMDERLLDAICDHLNLVFYIKHSCVVREGDPLFEMLFITRGTLLLCTGNDGTSYLEKGDFYGEELLEWALYSPSLSKFPFSTKTVYSLTKVEAFALTAMDLKNIVSKFLPHYNCELSQLRAASVVRDAWRYHSRKKPAARVGKKSESYGSIFAANAPSTTQRSQEARSVERIPPMLPQQPAEHDIIAKQL